LLPDQRLESLQVVGPQRGATPTPMRLGRDRAGAAVGLQEPDDEREADDEAAGDLADRALLALHGIEDALAEILGIAGHGTPPLRHLPSNRMPTNRSAL
jgi:hypothetical protein